MTQARTQHTLTVVGDKIGELPFLKGQCHQSFQLEESRDNVPVSALRTLFLGKRKKGRIVHYTAAKFFSLCENRKIIFLIKKFPQYFAF